MFHIWELQPKNDSLMMCIYKTNQKKDKNAIKQYKTNSLYTC